MKDTFESSEEKFHRKCLNDNISPVGIKAIQGRINQPSERLGVVHCRDLHKIHIPRTQELKLKDCEPNVVYEKNGYDYQMDGLGRPIEISGKLKLRTGIRTVQQTEIGRLGRSKDDGGHLIGNRFDGPPDAFNIRPQYSGLNRGRWGALENSWAKEIRNGRNVHVKINPRYIGSSIRPSQYCVDYVMDGKYIHKKFSNRTPSV